MPSHSHIIILLSVCTIIGTTGCKKTNSQVSPGNLPIDGNHWQKIIAPTFGKFNDLQFGGGDTIYILGIYTATAPVYNILIKSFDAGNTWVSRTLPNQFLNDTSDGTLQKISLYPFRSNTIFSGGNNLIRSIDGGFLWNRVDTPKTKVSPNFHFFDPANGIGIGSGMVFKTVDSGLTWNKIYTAPGIINFDRLQFTSRQIGYFVGGVYFDNTNSGIIGKTIDGGNTWQLINYPFKDIVAMYFLNDSIGFIAYLADNTLYKTIDGGQTWNAISQSSNNTYGNALSIFFTSEKDGFVTSQYGIFHTVDGGYSWSREYGPSVMLIKNNSSNVLYAIDSSWNILKRSF
jgi:photosystem II stability/assembly factor-like uncharacterized protein